MLINCPNCGKPVSDTISECPHCKVALEKKEGKRYYNDLSYEEKLKLEKEYAEEHSCKTLTELKNSFAINHKIGFTSLIIAWLSIIYIVINIFMKDRGINIFSNSPIVGTIFTFGSFGLCILCVILSAVFAKRKNNINKQYELHFAEYKKWLKEKQIYQN